MSQHERILNNQYKITAKLGEGGMGVVYKALDLTLDREVALKMIRPSMLDDPEILQRFRREAKALARLNHPNIATLHNLIDSEEGQSMVMEFVEGESLDKIVRRYGPLPMELAVQMIMQALEGLSHAHQRNVLHRDLKPSNLMLTRDGTIKIMDFGIARLTDSNSMHTSITNGLIGTFQYMAPELLDNSPASKASDLYALSLVLYQLLSGKAPFHAATLSQLINKILHEPPSPLPAIPSDLDQLLRGMLSKNPEVRLSDSRQLLEKLSQIAPFRSIIKMPVDDQTIPTRFVPESKSGFNPPLLVDLTVNSSLAESPPNPANQKDHPAKATLPPFRKNRIGLSLLIVAGLALVFGILFVYRSGQPTTPEQPAGAASVLEMKTPPPVQAVATSLDKPVDLDTVSKSVVAKPRVEKVGFLEETPEIQVEKVSRKALATSTSKVFRPTRPTLEKPEPQGKMVLPAPTTEVKIEEPETKPEPVAIPAEPRIRSTVSRRTSIRLTPVREYKADELHKGDVVEFRVDQDVLADTKRIAVRKGALARAIVAEVKASNGLDRSYIILKSLKAETSAQKDMDLEAEGPDPEISFFGEKRENAVIKARTMKPVRKFEAEL